VSTTGHERAKQPAGQISRYAAGRRLSANSFDAVVRICCRVHSRPRTIFFGGTVLSVFDPQCPKLNPASALGREPINLPADGL
jgi:hypothetical protein